MQTTFTLEDLALRLGVTVERVRTLIRRYNILPASGSGKTRLFAKNALDALRTGALGEPQRSRFYG